MRAARRRRWGARCIADCINTLVIASFAIPSAFSERESTCKQPPGNALEQDDGSQARRDGSLGENQGGSHAGCRDHSGAGGAGRCVAAELMDRVIWRPAAGGTVPCGRILLHTRQRRCSCKPAVPWPGPSRWRQRQSSGSAFYCRAAASAAAAGGAAGQQHSHPGQPQLLASHHSPQHDTQQGRARICSTTCRD